MRVIAVPVFLAYMAVASPQASATVATMGPSKQPFTLTGIGPNAAAPLTRRLSLPAPLGERAHAAARLTRARLELQLGGQEPFLGACARSRVDRLDLAIADVEVLRRACAPLAVAVDGLDTQHMAPGFIAECAGVHGQRAAKSARNAPEEFRLRQSPVHAGARNARARHAGLAVNPAL